MAVVGVVVAVAAIASADSVKLKNPGFESGTFKAWKTFNDGGGRWFVYRRGDEIPVPDGPIRGIGLPGQAPNPPRGNRAAIASQGGPGLNILHRVLRPRRDAEVNKLRFFLYYRNMADDFASPNNFGFGTGMPRFRGGDGPPNQQVRVDLMKRRAPLTSLEPRHILATLLRTRPGDDLVRRYKPVWANLTALGINRRFRLRIAEVDNQSPLFVGVDALKLKFRP